MRWLAIFSGLTLFATAASAAGVQFVRVWPQWRNADAFDRIGQYFGREETHHRELVVRSRPDDRAGLYFIVRVQGDAPVNGGTFVLDVIRPDDPDPKHHTFAVSLPARKHMVELGLTGKDWPGGHDAHPVAWKVTLLDAAGNSVATEQSFLWSNPTH